MANLTQRRKVGVAGSFINQIMGNNNTAPIVGQWATQLHYTDRTVLKVVEVSEDGKIAKLEYYQTSADKSVGNLPHGHQCWKHEPTGQFKTIQYRKDKWVTIGREIVFTKEFAVSIEEKYNSPCIGVMLSKHEPELCANIYAGDIRPQNIVDGITKEKKTYTPISIIFNACDYHYDWSF